jgi:ribosome modulation factor
MVLTEIARQYRIHHRGFEVGAQGKSQGKNPFS